MKTFPFSPAMIGMLIVIAISSGLRGDDSPGIVLAKSLPPELQSPSSMRPKLSAVDFAYLQGGQTAKSAALDFEKSVLDNTVSFKAGNISTSQLKNQVEVSFELFLSQARFVHLLVKAPTGSKLEWKPVYGGDWQSFDDQGCFVGFGLNLLRVTKPGFKAFEEKITTKTNPTVRTVALQPL